MSIQRLNNEQLKLLAQTIASIGNGFFIASFVPFLIGLEQLKISVVILMLIVSIFCWIASIILLGEIKNDNHTRSK
jgi:cadmium resistance protein CadD (predicted permease)